MRPAPALALSVLAALAAGAPAAELPSDDARRALSLLPTAGAPLDTQRYRMQRPILFEPEPGAPPAPDRDKAASGPDLYELELLAADLGLLKPDLSDVRVVDESDHQVPYVLAERSARARLDLPTETSEPGPSGDERLSRYRLRAQVAGRTLALPYAAIELYTDDAVFSRGARLLDAAAGRYGPPVLWSGTLSRQGESPAPLTLPLDGTPRAELWLEVDEGDNPRLVWSRIAGVVEVPRLLLKLDPQRRYRLLLGSEAALPPRYDIEALRQALLSYAALPARLGDLLPNRGFRPSARDYFQGAESSFVLWGALLLAVVTLLTLTLRLLQRSDGENG